MSKESALEILGMIALAAVVVSGVWQGILPRFDARGTTRFARELVAAPPDQWRGIATGWALRRWVTLTVAPFAIVLAAGAGLGRIDDGAVGALRIALPLSLSLLNAVWHLATTAAAVRRLERPLETGGRR